MLYFYHVISTLSCFMLLQGVASYPWNYYSFFKRNSALLTAKTAELVPACFKWMLSLTEWVYLTTRHVLQLFVSVYVVIIVLFFIIIYPHSPLWSCWKGQSQPYCILEFLLEIQCSINSVRTADIVYVCFKWMNLT